jgi:CheY-like chemotaxis protein
LELEFVEFDVRSVVNSIFTANLDKCKEKGIEFFCRVDNSVPQTLYGDPTRISQILYNLVSNSIKFTTKGFVKISLTETLASLRPIPSSPLTDSENQSGKFVWNHPKSPFWLQMSVQDSGIGIDADTLSRLFDPYSHQKLSIVRQYGGTGLGLAICKQLSTRMCGDIEVETEIGEGSTFKVRVCLGKGKPKLPTPVKEEKVMAVIEEKMDVATLESRLNHLRVLYADDQPINRKLMERFLKNCNPKLILVENGLEAVRYVRRAKNIERSRSQSRSRSHERSRVSAEGNYLDVILLDLNMPVMDGREAAMLIRELDEEIPIVAVTANAIQRATTESDLEKMDEDSLLLFRGVFSDVASKPITKEDLLSLLFRLTAPRRTISQEVSG